MLHRVVSPLQPSFFFRPMVFRVTSNNAIMDRAHLMQRRCLSPTVCYCYSRRSPTVTWTRRVHSCVVDEIWQKMSERRRHSGRCHRDDLQSGCYGHCTVLKTKMQYHTTALYVTRGLVAITDKIMVTNGSTDVGGYRHKSDSQQKKSTKSSSVMHLLETYRPIHCFVDFALNFLLVSYLDLE